MAGSNGSEPLWQKIVTDIRHNIEQELWPVDQQIPSERELCAQYGVSRTTVRLAIAEAEKSGLLRRVHGKGTFVLALKIKQPLVHLTSFAETLQARGLVPGMIVLKVRQQTADMATARLLGLPPGGDVISFDLLGLGNDEPMALYQSTVPARLGEPLRTVIERHGDARQYYMVNQLLAEQYGWSFLKAEQTYEAGQAGSEEAQLLSLPRRAPVFRVTSLFQNPDGQFVEFRRATYRADKYQFHVTRQMYFREGRGL